MNFAISSSLNGLQICIRLVRWRTYCVFDIEQTSDAPSLILDIGSHTSGAVPGMFERGFSKPEPAVTTRSSFRGSLMVHATEELP